eukprot:TRINITY_DN25031_c0_g1_i1.p1 TRINITY_DN25031_c0_g1~~TRINITY_DN25031_c0_g1_i1.p1  ORF type:complete len:327 (+),score=58.95 TRINITY_DN25031_c0_g1_i1:29-1009(+)
MGIRFDWVCFFFFKQKTAYEMLRSLVGSEMCIRDSILADSPTPTFSRRMVRFGHALIRYTLPDGSQHIMNINGHGEGRETVNFVVPHEYLFGTEGWSGAVEQGGVYNRGFWGLRIERVPEGTVEALHAYYTACKLQLGLKHARFKLFGGRVGNFVQQWMPFYSEASWSGNCAQWTSSGMEFVNMIRRPRMFPKAILVEAMHKHMIADPENVHLVNYREVKDCVKFSRPGMDGKPFGPGDGYSLVSASPFKLVDNLYFWNLSKFASAVVEVPPGQMAAVVRKCKRAVPWFPIRFVHTFIVIGLLGWMVMEGHTFLAIALVVWVHWIY